MSDVTATNLLEWWRKYTDTPHPRTYIFQLEIDGIADAIEKPEFAAAVGLAMFAAEENQASSSPSKKSKKAKSGNKTSFFKKIFSKFWQTLDFRLN